MYSRARPAPRLQLRSNSDGAPESAVGSMPDSQRHPINEELRDIVLDGLLRHSKSLPSKLLYDQQGSELFEKICEQPEYYLTRTELQIMRTFSVEMASALGPDITLVEYGSGSSLKTRLLLNALKQPVAYIPVDISNAALSGSVQSLRREMPELTVLPQCADFTQPIVPLPQSASGSRTVIYFPGSTIGNFEATEAVRLLRQMWLQMGSAGGALIGFDLKKDADVIELAYNDAAGYTAAFTLNLLQRLNRELNADFDLQSFRHCAEYRPVRGRIETHIISQRDQHVRVAGESIHFERGEAMLIEISCKYSMQNFADLAALAGMRVGASWTDPQQQFCVQYLVSA